MSRRFLLAYLPAALLLASAGFFFWLLHTVPGARWAWNRAVAASDGALRTDGVHGDIRSGLELLRVRFDTDSTSIEAPTVELRLDFDLFPPAVSIEGFDAAQILVTPRAAADGNPALGATTAPEDVLPGLATSVPINLEDARIGELQVRDTEGQPLFSATELAVDARLEQTLQLLRAQADSVDAAWELQGQLGLTAPFAIELVATSRMENPELSSQVLEARASFKGDLDAVDVDASLAAPAATLRGRITDPAGTPGLELNLDAPTVQWPLDAVEPDLVLRAVSARIGGGWQSYTLSANSNVEAIDAPEVAATLKGQGNFDGLLVEDLHLAGDGIDLNATGTLNWGEAFTVALDATIAQLAPGHWIADWPRDQALQGKVSLGWEGERVHLTALDVTAGTSRLRIAGSGELDPEQDIIEGQFTWSEFQWPLGTKAPDVRSEQGEISLGGSPSDWNASGTMQLQAGEWPDGNVRLSGTGDSESAHIRIEQGEVLGGSFDGTFDYAWTGTEAWSTEMRIRNLDLSALAEYLPRSIDGEWSAAGQLEPLAFEAHLDSIRGQLRGQPLAADGVISFRDGALFARDLDIRVGTSNLSLDGNPESPEGLRFSAHTPDLGELFADAGGKFSGEGILSVNDAEPRLELDAEGSDLVFGDWQVGGLNIAGTESESGERELRLEITDTALGEREWRVFSITTAGDNLFDRIDVHAQRDTTQWDIQLRGDARLWPQWLASAWRENQQGSQGARWQGQIETWSIEDEQLGWLRLEAPSPLSFNLDSLDAGPACLRGARDGRICADARFGGAEPSQADARLDGVSLSALSLLTRTKIEFTQRFTGDIHWHRAPGALTEAEVDIDISPGEIIFPDSEKPLVTGVGRFAFRISGGKLLAGNLDLDFPEAGVIDTNFDVPDLSQGGNSPVEGRIRIGLRDIGPMLAWIPEIDRASGSVQADVQLGGSVAEPRFTGHAVLVGGALEHNATGTVISDLQLAGAVYQFDHAELNGSFRAGEGQGQLKATLQFDDVFKPVITLDVAGRNLRVLNVPDLQVIADPDLKFHWHDGLLKLDGEVLVPKARISPRYIPTSTVSESADLVIVAGAPPPEEKSAFDRSRLRLNGTVDVALGDDVTVTLERATARLTGKTAFTWKDSLVPMANGHYSVSGRIAAYGQLLEVSEGRISFPNIPADNPQLNIRAERDIYGNVQVRKAGVLLSGTLRRPTLEPYTMPATTGERAMAMLVTGHDFDSEQGVGGVEVGMYIAPKLYVSYGIGLFENQSVISARYEIKGGLGVRASSGQRETGADVSYTIER